MGVQIGAKPDSGFDDPIGMLTDCHRRIEQFLKILATVVERAVGRNLTGEETSAVQSALRYFRAGGVRHTADEEESLFPRLRNGSAEESLAKLEALEADHHEAADLHDTVEQLYSTWIAGSGLGLDEQRQLQAVTHRLSELYYAHIRVEESVVFPQAAQVLDPAAIAAMGEEFRARRA
jgi:hemerythrin-like domain-containing protein